MFSQRAGNMNEYYSSVGSINGMHVGVYDVRPDYVHVSQYFEMTCKADTLYDTAPSYVGNSPIPISPLNYWQ